MREDQERRRSFGGIDENAFVKKKFSMANPPPPPQIEGTEMFTLALGSARNSISSNRKDNYKMRLTNGISVGY